MEDQNEGCLVIDSTLIEKTRAIESNERSGWRNRNDPSDQIGLNVRSGLIVRVNDNDAVVPARSVSVGRSCMRVKG